MNNQHQKTNAGSLLEQEVSIAKNINSDYQEKFGFSDQIDNSEDFGKGVSEEIVRKISEIKQEPDWMLERRIKAFREFENRPNPIWGGDLDQIDYQDIHYFVRATDKQGKSWDEVPDKIKQTFDRLGIPQAERKFLAGVASQYESEVIYHKLKDKWQKLGIIFEDTDSGLKKYPQIFKKYFGTVIPYADNKLAALNTAVWSGGSFIYVPKGVKVELPLQAYFRINAQNMGQFERTLIIADEDSEVTYIEGCFTKGHKIKLDVGEKLIEDIKVGDLVTTHTGNTKEVYHTQVRPYSGNLYRIHVKGFTLEEINTTDEHPFFAVKRERDNERNKSFEPKWIEAKDLSKNDYLAIPIDQEVISPESHSFDVLYKNKKEQIIVANLPEFYRLIGYYLSEGSVDDRGYLRFSFNVDEREYIEDVKSIIKQLFQVGKFNEFTYNDRQGLELVFSSAKLARIFSVFGTKANNKSLPDWFLKESHVNQTEFIKGYFRGDGNYYKVEVKHGLKEIFRFCTVSEKLAFQTRDTLLRLGIFAYINKRDRSHEEGRQPMYTIGVSGEYMLKLGKLLDVSVEETLNNKKRATYFHITSEYAYAPISSIEIESVENIDVYNFSVKDDESYICNSFAVHNCTAPTYSTNSLHSAVVEIICLPRSKVRYTTIQNWSDNVFNLVTKRAFAYEDATMEWIDCNIGSKLTMKYPAIHLLGKRAHGEVLSIAIAGKGQHQDAGAKIIHKAADTSSVVTSKSICKDGGRASYRGLLKINKGAVNARSKVICDALILDSQSRTDTYPTNDIREKQSQVGHEASVSKVSEEQLFYLMSRGLDEDQAAAMIVSGFIEPVIKELPMEYAAEMNALIQMSMEGSVG